MEENQVPGWGIDRRPEERPGYPLEQPRANLYDTQAGVPVYSETIPLRGLSGLLRRRAHRLPDWRSRRWMMLMLADRVDVFESKLVTRALLCAAGLGAALLFRRLRR